MEIFIAKNHKSQQNRKFQKFEYKKSFSKNCQIQLTLQLITFFFCCRFPENHKIIFASQITEMVDEQRRCSFARKLFERASLQSYNLFP